MFVNGNLESIEVTPQQEQAYNALKIAAERIGMNNYNEQSKQWLKTHKNMKKFRFTVTEEHDMIVKAMPQVLSGEITPEEAMIMLWDYEVMKQRGVLKEVKI